MITLNRKVRFSHSDLTYSGVNYTEYLFGSIGLKVNADIRVEVAWSTESVNMNFDGAADTIQRKDGGSSSWITDGFRIGDTVVFTGTVSNNVTTTITDLTDELMSVTAGALMDELVVANAWGETPITSIDFYPNKIENNSAFSLFDLTDRETIPKYFADTISTSAGSPTTMTVGTNSKGWITPDESATIYRLSFTNHIQTFVISHTFYITPIYLASQLSNVQHGLAPAAGKYKDRECLKYVYTIDGKFSAFDPTIPHTTDGNVEFPKGQTGWFNEFINGRPSIWRKESLLYTDNATGAGLSAVDYCKVVDVVAVLNCDVAAIEPRFKVQVMWLPRDEDRYINTLTELKTNFIYERALTNPSSGTTQGENTGDYHFIKNVTSTSLSGSRKQINFQIDFSQVVTDFFNTQDSDNLNYLIFITAQDYTNTTTILSINQTAVIMDVNVYECDKDDSTLFQIIDEVQFFEYPHCNGVGYSNFSLLPMDTVVMKAQFHVKQGTYIDPIILNKITASIVAVRQNDVEEFPLEEFSISTNQFFPNCDNIQEIEFEQQRDFIIPIGDCRNEIKLFRMPTLDISGYSAYELIYPFKVRWEEWRQLERKVSNTDTYRCFPTPTQNWMIYANQAGWSIKFSIRAEVEDKSTAHTTEFEHIVWGEIKDPCEIPYAVEFSTSDSTGLQSFEDVVATDTDTFVEATITGDFSGYTVDQLYGILTLDAWGVGGVAYSQEIGNRLDVDSDFVWYGATSTLKAKLTKVSNNTLTLSAFINYLYLPKDTNQFILSARIGYYEASSSSSGADCMDEIMIESFTCGELEIIEVTGANTFIVSGEVETEEMRGVQVKDMILTFLTSTTWTVSGGTINGNPILSGTVGGLVIKAPIHPYTDANVSDTIQGNLTGTLNSSITEINGIGDMQIGCTFFVS